MEDPPAVDLGLLAVLQPVQESIAKRALNRDPRILRRAHARRARDVPVVSRQGEERTEMRAQGIGGRQVQCVIALAHVERAAIHLNALDHIRNINVRIGVPVAVRIR